MGTDLISTKFCTAIEVVDIITSDKFFRDWFKDIDFVAVENRARSLTKPVAVNTGLHNCAACEEHNHL